jgi:DNA-binding CsgD family transcriptional regulator
VRPQRGTRAHPRLPRGRDANPHLEALKLLLGARVALLARSVKLTKREQEVLEWLTEPGTIAAIAQRHRNTKGTLRKHIDNLRNKTGCRKRELLVLWGRAYGRLPANGKERNT